MKSLTDSGAASGSQSLNLQVGILITSQNRSDTLYCLQQRVIQSGLDSLSGPDSLSICVLFKALAVVSNIYTNVLTLLRSYIRTRCIS